MNPGAAVPEPPSDEVERSIVALQRGAGDDVDVVDALRSTMLDVVAGDQGGVLVATDEDGLSYCALYSRPAANLHRAPVTTMLGEELLTLLPRPINLIVNGDGPIGIRMLIDD